MDNPNVSVKDLFAAAQESFERYLSKQRSLVQQSRHPSGSQPAASHGPSDARHLHNERGRGHSNGEGGETTAPSYAKLVSFESVEKRSSSSTSSSSSNRNNGAADRSSSFSDSHTWTPFESPSDPTPLDKRSNSIKANGAAPSRATSPKSWSSDAHDTSQAHPHFSPASAEEPPLTTSLRQETPFTIKKCSPMPECVPASEMRRREAVGASLRATCEELLRAEQKQNDFKPLSWDKPSFHFPRMHNAGNNNADHANHHCEFSSSIQLTGKRKECGGNTDALTVNYKGIETITPRSLGAPPVELLSSAPHRQVTSSSNSASLYGYYPYYQHQCTKEEVADFVAFADEWITPGMKRRKTK